ncbi:putative peptide methionine sulfoxide reductase [Yarrowia sp. C11]|nr:putative peptide methionine sulfoxide reductase [Yarrowia sp. C11]KAG5370593.1 putative peptide methionine sulfoxide reductase [Yarrowia sp. E02]
MPSVSPTLKTTPTSELLTVAAGCFWGVEHMYRKHFGDKGLVDAKVGYSGGNTDDPSYRKVCSGTTGHAEALQLSFDPEKVSYGTLVDFFFKIHDPTQANGQGPDIGSQYRSAVFTHSPEQQKTAEQIKTKLQDSWFKDPIATDIEPIQNWWDAEDYHQEYLFKEPGGYQCPTHFLRTSPQK